MGLVHRNLKKALDMLTLAQLQENSVRVSCFEIHCNCLLEQQLTVEVLLVLSFHIHQMIVLQNLKMISYLGY